MAEPEASNPFGDLLSVSEIWPGRPYSLRQVHEIVQTIRFTSGPSQAAQLIRSLVQGDLSQFGANSHTWHNTITEAQILNEYEAAYALTLESLQQWPDDVDLLCDHLQHLYTHFYDENAAREVRDELDQNLSAPRHWRYWVYSAMHEVTTYGNTEAALSLLDQGLLQVKLDDLRDVFAAYRRVLIDGPPMRPIADSDDLDRYYTEVRSMLESRLRRGVELGVENGHTLLVELARLALEGSVDSTDESDTELEFDKQILEKALGYIETAERTFVGDPNHRIEAVYAMKAKVLMAMRRYRDAQEVMLAIPESVVERDQSLSTMFEYASISLGLKSANVQRRSRDSGPELSPSLSLPTDGDIHRDYEEQRLLQSKVDSDAR